MKIYLESRKHPWIMWPISLWRESNKLKDGIITSKKSEADIYVIEYEDGLDFNFEKPTYIYVESIEKNTLDELKEKFNDSTIKFISDSISVAKKIEENVSQCYLWIKPTRVPELLWYKGDGKSLFNIKEENFIMVGNGSRLIDNMRDVIKVFFKVCLKKDEDGFIEFTNDLDIFSAQDLKFEPFNNIYFHGHQPNPMLFSKIKTSKLFISPYDGNGVPISAIDAAFLGTPVIVRNTETNRTCFPWRDYNFFSDNKELGNILKYYSNIDKSSSTYLIDIIETNYNQVVKTFTPSNSYKNLLEIIGD